MVAESIGLALLTVLESLIPPERLAFVLHDIFAVPFENIGQIMDRTAESARQLASRALADRSKLQHLRLSFWPGPPGIFSRI